MVRPELREELVKIESSELAPAIEALLIDRTNNTWQYSASIEVFNSKYPNLAVFETVIREHEDTSGFSDEAADAVVLGGLSSLTGLTRLKSKPLTSELKLVPADEYRKALDRTLSKKDLGMFEAADFRGSFVREYPTFADTTRLFTISPFVDGYTRVQRASLMIGGLTPLYAFKEMIDFADLNKISTIE